MDTSAGPAALPTKFVGALQEAFASTSVALAAWNEGRRTRASSDKGAAAQLFEIAKEAVGALGAALTKWQLALSTSSAASTGVPTRAGSSADPAASQPESYVRLQAAMEVATAAMIAWRERAPAPAPLQGSRLLPGRLTLRWRHSRR